MPPPTIIAHKSTFLTTQTLQLSQTLAPSAAWRATNERAQDGLSPRAVDDALYRLNHTLSQHARRVYAPQASRHVAEQIEGLFHDEVERASRGGEENDDEQEGDESARGGERQQLRVGADFTTDEAIASLSPTWDAQKPGEASDHPLETRRYAELAAVLASLSARRREARERVDRLRRMAALLAPFESSDDDTAHIDDPSEASHTVARPRISVQENLVTRNGSLERELERMRLLLARVAGRVAQLPDRSAAASTGEDEATTAGYMDIDSLERVKVEKLLDRR